MKNISLIFLIYCLITSCIPETLPENRLHHVILVWFKNSTPELINKITSETQNLKKIEQVRSIHLGKAVPSARKIVDSSFDLGIVMTFDNETDMNIYLKNKIHLEFVKNFIEGQVRKIVIYDF